MTFLRFLYFEKSALLLYFAGTLITAASFFADSRGGWTWGTYFYAFALCSIVLIGYLLLRYRHHVRVIRQWDSEDGESLSLEGEIARQHIEELKKRHIRELNQIQARQREHYDFIVSWFHEIKTPIAVLRLLQQTDLDADSVREEVAKIEHYVDQALFYAKLDSFNQDYEIQYCDMIRIAKEVVKSHAKTFFSKKIRIDIRAETLTVRSDPKWLQFIVNQLITNSLKYTEAGGTITISASETAQEKQLRIRDSGIGISRADLPRIFNRGFTGETGRIHSKSTGMGLYLAQQLANKLGYYLTCDSEVGVFTEFTIHFPIDNDPYLTAHEKTQ